MVILQDDGYEEGWQNHRGSAEELHKGSFDAL